MTKLLSKTILLLTLLVFCINASAQDIYWVFFTDKANTEFNPYAYFDEKAIARRAAHGVSLYDLSDYPLNAEYVQSVSALSEEVIGESRWFNALAVSTFQIEEIERMPFVMQVRPVELHAHIAHADIDFSPADSDTVRPAHQLRMMQGEQFDSAGINGKGIRIAVFDAGFPMVDKHPAFQHLRDNHQIIQTYNFPLRQKNVYGWNSHGTMVLSCIAGYDTKGEMLGLATGAEFLLARTETAMERHREEVWWMMAMEWADRNGADIISSSLGYGKELYKSEEMDGTSLVARAANMAASKGMLVCNAMGNEGDDPAWSTLVTPADADSVLSVGAVEAYGKFPDPTYFTSPGPTADGRRKPNVCAIGEWVSVANPSQKRPYIYSAAGTSFSTPLVAGFAACAWQAHRELTNMQLFEEIERSGDLYPYYDYFRGYGIPQASYFLKDKKEPAEELPFTFYEDSTSIYIVLPKEKIKGRRKIWMHIADKDGKLLWSNSFFTDLLYPFSYIIEPKIESDTVSVTDTDSLSNVITIDKKPEFLGQTLRVKYLEYSDEYIIGSEMGKGVPDSIQGVHLTELVCSSAKIAKQSKFAVWQYLSWGFAVPSNPSDEWQTVNYGKSESVFAGLRFMGNLCKWYSLGGALEIGAHWYNLSDPVIHLLDKYGDDFITADRLRKCNVRVSQINLEFLHRFRIVRGGLGREGFFFEAGIFGGWDFWYRQRISTTDHLVVKQRVPKDLRPYFHWGMRARFGYDLIAVFAEYRLSRLFGKDKLFGQPDFPKLEVGLQFSFPYRR